MSNRARLPFSYFIALRYLRPKRTFLSVITLISITGVVLGVAVLIVAGVSVGVGVMLGVALAVAVEVGVALGVGVLVGAVIDPPLSGSVVPTTTSSMSVWAVPA